MSDSDDKEKVARHWPWPLTQLLQLSPVLVFSSAKYVFICVNFWAKRTQVITMFGQRVFHGSIGGVGVGAGFFGSASAFLFLGSLFMHKFPYNAARAKSVFTLLFAFVGGRG